MSIDAMKQALEYIRPGAIVPVTPETVKILVDVLRLAIEQAEKQEPVIGTKTWHEDGKVIKQNLYPSDVYKEEKQEPVAYTQGHCKEKAKPGGCQLHNLHCGYPACDRKATAAPPQRQPLTNETLWEMWVESPSDVLQFARIIERAHGIGGGE